MKDDLTFEQQLAALIPANIETDVGAAMYRCGFAAGQASGNPDCRDTSHRDSARHWLQLAVAACLTAILVGPVSYRFGHLNQNATVVERDSPPTAPVADAPAVDAPIADAPAAFPNRGPVNETAVTPARPAGSNARQRSSNDDGQRTIPTLAHWLAGITAPNATVPETMSSDGVMITSRPPSADMTAWLEQSRPHTPSHLDTVDAVLVEPNIRDREGRKDGPNRFEYHNHLPPLPSRKSLNSWETWIQS